MTAASFAALYAEHSPRVRRALVLAGADRDSAADVAQEAFARTYARWRLVRTGSNPPGYVFRVAFRELRRRGKLPDEPDGDEHAERTAGDGRGPEELALANVAADAALRAIEAMPPRRRACALLVLAAGVTAEEAGQALGIAPSTVRVHVHRARTDLRALPALARTEVVKVTSEPVKQFETRVQDFFCASLVMVGLLIQATVGILGGAGRRLQNRVGSAA